MLKVNPKARRAAAAVAAVAAFAAIWLFLRRDAYIVSAVGTYGSAILGVKVSLGGAHLDVPNQSLELRGLSVGNPPGFKSRELLHADLIRVALDVSSLAGDVVRIREITLLKPEITYEKYGAVSNVDVLQKNANTYVGAPAPGAKGTAAGPGKRWIIDEVVVREAKATVLQDMLLTKTLVVPVPNVHLRNIGKRNHGATTADATQQVLSALTASVANAAGAAIAGAASGVGRELGKGAKSLGSALHGLFGK